MIAFTIEGDKRLLKKLERLKKSAQKKIIRRGVTAAVRPIRMQAKSDAPKETGQLKKKLTVKVKAYKSGNVFGMVSVANEKDAATGRRPSKYLHLVTLGTKPHAIVPRKKKLLVGTSKTGERTVFGKSVQHPGAKKQDFLTAAIKAKQSESVAKFSEVVRSGILSEAQKG